MRSRWDTLHPGRSWLEKLQSNVFTSEQVGVEAMTWLLSQEMGG
jgi:hypothetical protein